MCSTLLYFIVVRWSEVIPILLGEIFADRVKVRGPEEGGWKRMLELVR